MNKIINFSDKENTEKRCRDLTDKVETLSSKPNKLSSLTFSIAALSGCLVFALPVHAEFNIPTENGLNPVPVPSPLCIGDKCAYEFEDKLLLFEEFGLENISSSDTSSSSIPLTFPVPADCDGIPNGDDLDDFLREDLHSIPTRKSDETDAHELITATNPWEAKVKDCLGLPADMIMPADGRPTGEWFAHQRWDEFPAQAYFQSVQTGARVNGGLRDKKQLHEYKVGEFRAPDPDHGDPGGLYYVDADGDGKPGNEGLSIKMNHNLPTQDPQHVWTFDGTLPPKLLMARYGESILFRHYDALPIDPGANGGFGKNTISTHEHNGHNPAESDGFMHAYFYPGQFYDYHWPMVLAGHDSINTGATDLKTGAPDGDGGITRVQGDWHETMSTHWFHDHMLDYTAQNVYKGNAAMMNYYSAIDRGREPVDLTEASTGISGSSGRLNPGYGCHYKNANNANLCLPSGSGLDWGNRDYDMNLVVADKAWDSEGQLKFNIFNTDGYLGDRITVNWLYKPYVDVRARRYRFRVLNGSVSRYYKIAVVDSGGKVVPSFMIANDGNIMQHAIPFPNAQSTQAWPEQGIAERYDMIIDFKGMVGKKLYLVNLLEHKDGKGPNKVIPLADVLSGKYRADGKNGDPGVGKFLEFRVKGCNETTTCSDFSMNPAEYQEKVTDPVTKKVVPGKQMIPLNKPTTQELKAAVHRSFVFGRSNATDLVPWTIKTDGGAGLPADPTRVSAAPQLPSTPNGLGKVEIWHLSGGLGWSHPVHVHFEEGQILKRGGIVPPIWEKYARKDVYRIGTLPDSTSNVDIAIRFREFGGTYVEHCHNTQHEDKAMLLRWDLEHPGQTLAIPTPEPDWDGVRYDPSIYLPSAKTGDVAAKQAFILP
jgi:manganese oxidase